MYKLHVRHTACVCSPAVTHRVEIERQSAIKLSRRMRQMFSADGWTVDGTWWTGWMSDNGHTTGLCFALFYTTCIYQPPPPPPPPLSSRPDWDNLHFAATSRRSSTTNNKNYVSTTLWSVRGPSFQVCARVMPPSLLLPFSCCSPPPPSPSSSGATR